MSLKTGRLRLGRLVWKLTTTITIIITITFPGARSSQDHVVRIMLGPIPGAILRRVHRCAQILDCAAT